MSSTQVLAVSAPWIIAVIGFVAYLAWPKPQSRPAASAPKEPGAMTLNEAMAAINGLTAAIATQQRTSEDPYPARSDTSAPTRQQPVPERISS